MIHARAETVACNFSLFRCPGAAPPTEVLSCSGRSISLDKAVRAGSGRKKERCPQPLDSCKARRLPARCSRPGRRVSSLASRSWTARKKCTDTNLAVSLRGRHRLRGCKWRERGPIHDRSFVAQPGPPRSFTEGLPAFINCTRESLCSGIVGTLPKDLVVLEILEDVPADEETLRACWRLKQAGYRIALDDIVSAHDRLALFEVADIIKVDFLLTGLVQYNRKRLRGVLKRGVHLLAEKVETHEQFQAVLILLTPSN